MCAVLSYIASLHDNSNGLITRFRTTTSGEKERQEPNEKGVALMHFGTSKSMQS